MYGAHGPLNPIDRVQPPYLQMPSTLILLIIITTSLVTITASTPITIGALILIQAILISLSLMGLSSSWFSIILFIIYIGGLLVIFSYFIALGPNQHIYLLPTSMFALALFILLSYNLAQWPIRTSIINLLSSTPIPPLTIYDQENSLILILLVIVLFLALILVVKITNRSAGPLRPFNYV